jgi:flagellar biosynthesis protein FlhB
MFYQVPMLLAIFLAVVYPESGGDMALASLMVVFSSMFYMLMFSAMSGTKQVDLDLEISLNSIWQSRVVSLSGAVALYAVGMIEVFYYVLPFQLISLFCDLLATGFKLGYLGMEEVEPEEDDDNY